MYEVGGETKARDAFGGVKKRTRCTKRRLTCRPYYSYRQQHNSPNFSRKLGNSGQLSLVAQGVVRANGKKAIFVSRTTHLVTDKVEVWRPERVNAALRFGRRGSFLEISDTCVSLLMTAIAP